MESMQSQYESLDGHEAARYHVPYAGAAVSNPNDVDPYASRFLDIPPESLSSPLTRSRGLRWTATSKRLVGLGGLLALLYVACESGSGGRSGKGEGGKAFGQPGHPLGNHIKLWKSETETGSASSGPSSGISTGSSSISSISGGSNADLLPKEPVMNIPEMGKHLKNVVPKSLQEAMSKSKPGMAALKKLKDTVRGGGDEMDVAKELSEAATDKRTQQQAGKSVSQALGDLGVIGKQGKKVLSVIGNTLQRVDGKRGENAGGNEDDVEAPSTLLPTHEDAGPLDPGNEDNSADSDDDLVIASRPEERVEGAARVEDAAGAAEGR